MEQIPLIQLVEENKAEQVISAIFDTSRKKIAVSTLAAMALAAAATAPIAPTPAAASPSISSSTNVALGSTGMKSESGAVETVKVGTKTDMDGYTFTTAVRQNPISAKTADNLSAAVTAESGEAGTRKVAYVEPEAVAQVMEERSEAAIIAAATSDTGNLGEATGELKKTLDAAAAEKADQEDKARARKEAEEKAAREAYLASEEGQRETLVEAARSRLGVPYVWGGTDPDYGMDCSGFTQWCYSQIGMDIPRTTYSQAAAAETISVSEAKPGDILYSGGHVGLYIGDGVFIHEPQSGDVCRESTDMGQFYSALRFL